MNKTYAPNPLAPDFQIVRIQMNAEDIANWLTDTGLVNVPVGFRGYARVSGSLWEYGIEPIPKGAAGAVVAPVGGDTLDGLSVADLQTKCARSGITYGKEDGKVALIQLLRKGKP